MLRRKKPKITDSFNVKHFSFIHPVAEFSISVGNVQKKSRLQTSINNMCVCKGENPSNFSSEVFISGKYNLDFILFLSLYHLLYYLTYFHKNWALSLHSTNIVEILYVLEKKLKKKLPSNTKQKLSHTPFGIAHGLYASHK